MLLFVDVFGGFVGPYLCKWKIVMVCMAYSVMVCMAYIAHLPQHVSRLKMCDFSGEAFNPLNAELNPVCYLLALLGAHHFLHFSRIRVKSLTLRLLMSYIYIYIYVCGAPILDVSRSHTTTHHSR